MSDSVNPYQPPIEPSEPAGDGLTFGAVLKRGAAAAHGAPAGAVWMFFLMAPLQVIGAAMNAVMFGGDFFEKLQPANMQASGGQPPPEIFMMGGAGCFMCLWLPVIFFAMPWIWGGTIGQIRDRLFGKMPQPFGTHGKQHYVAMLLILLMFVAAVVVLSLPNAIVGQVIASSEMPPGQPPTGEQMRALSKHPGNIASSVVTGLLMTALGTMVNLLATATVARGRGIGDGLSQGVSFCRRNVGTLFKLYLVYVLLLLPFTVVQSIPQLLTPTVATAIGLGFVSSLYLAYLSILNFGLAGSLFAARTEHRPEMSVESPA